MSGVPPPPPPPHPQPLRAAGRGAAVAPGCSVGPGHWSRRRRLWASPLAWCPPTASVPTHSHHHSTGAGTRQVQAEALVQEGNQNYVSL